MNERQSSALVASMALATLAKSEGYLTSLQEWKALVKRKMFDRALQAEARSRPREAGIYNRWFFTEFAGASIIRHQQVVVAEVEGRFVIVASDGKQLNAIEIHAVGGFFERIGSILVDQEAS